MQILQKNLSMNFLAIIISMKKVLLFIVLSLIICSCEIIDKDFDTYTVLNETEHEISIDAYDALYYSDEKEKMEKWETSFYVDSIVIKPFDKYKVVKRIGEDAEGGRLFSTDGVDSVIITFNKTRSIVYTCSERSTNSCSGERNILNWKDYYTKSCEENRGCDYTYTITQEDYENAEIIE